ncbi:hypothetical protein J2S74_001571 [Evansella vedderi]|uniref:YheC/YheD family protein n=1 Tax=Evansella vedderi TaxID=38282 RepID=A0ABT9ZSI6_9BACI|nr:YheC/YheD family protein [Evansella vedderi]MDQ0254196.1 hypothetical protein [Evansella vedderi]
MKKNVVILTAPKERQKFSGEVEYYEQLLTSISEHGGMGFVLPLREDNILFEGYFWNNSLKQWQEVICPKPHIVYNRYPYRDGPETEPLRAYLKLLDRWEVPYFNSTFFNKQTIAKLFQGDVFLQHHFPRTLPLTGKTTLYNFLQKHRSIFLKDVNGSQGKGIWKINRIQKKYTLHSQQKVFSNLNFQQLAYLLQSIMRERIILLQETIAGITVNNHPYDFRVLMIFENNQWKLVGIGVRGASHGGYTTHVPQGGEVMSLHDVPVRPNPFHVKRIGKKIGVLLQNHYSSVREFSFDIIMDNHQKLWVLDVNSKPMSFDEKKIQESRLKMLTNIFLNDS